MNIQFEIFVNMKDPDEDKVAELMDRFGDVLEEAGYALENENQPFQSMIVAEPTQIEDDQSFTEWLAPIIARAYQIVFPAKSDELAAKIHEAFSRIVNEARS